MPRCSDRYELGLRRHLQAEAEGFHSPFQRGWLFEADPQLSGAVFLVDVSYLGDSVAASFSQSLIEAALHCSRTGVKRYVFRECQGCVPQKMPHAEVVGAPLSIRAVSEPICRKKLAVRKGRCRQARHDHASLPGMIVRNGVLDAPTITIAEREDVHVAVSGLCLDGSLELAGRSPPWNGCDAAVPKVEHEPGLLIIRYAAAPCGTQRHRDCHIHLGPISSGKRCASSTLLRIRDILGAASKPSHHRLRSRVDVPGKGQSKDVVRGALGTLIPPDHDVSDPEAIDRLLHICCGGVVRQETRGPRGRGLSWSDRRNHESEAPSSEHLLGSQPHDVDCVVSRAIALGRDLNARPGTADGVKGRDLHFLEIATVCHEVYTETSRGPWRCIGRSEGWHIVHHLYPGNPWESL
eukprot:scaffold825_cov249-Pinguiococcus_pyrenoidosus.AAC.13